MTTRPTSPAFVALVLTLAACVEPPESAATAASTSGGEDESSTDPGSASDSGSTDGADESTGEPIHRTGAELFAALCSSCHGPEAAGTSLAYELRHPARDYAAFVVRNGRSGTELAPSVMPAFPPELLGDDELERVLDFLDAFPRAQGGEALYLDHCRNCHGTNARGGEARKDISDQELHDARERVREGSGDSGYGARLEYMPAVDPEALTDDELQLVIDYVQSL